LDQGGRRDAERFPRVASLWPDFPLCGGSALTPIPDLSWSSTLVACCANVIDGHASYILLALVTGVEQDA
jgi:hypothetical protein